MVRRAGQSSFAVSKAREALRSLAAWFPVTALLGVLPGLVAWQLSHPRRIGDLAANARIPQVEVLVFAAISLAATFAACFAFSRPIRKGRAHRFEGICRKFNRYASIFTVVPIFIFLRGPSVGEKFPFFSIFASLAVGAIGAVYAYRVIAARPSSSPRDEKRFRLSPLLAVFALFAAYSVTISCMHLIHHRSFGTDAWDFGLYVNTMWRSLHGDLLGCSFLIEGNHASRHFDPILILLSPMLLVHRSAETLLVFQAVWVGSSVFPLYFIAKRRLRSPWIGFALGAVYALHPAVHGPNLYDFHSLVIAGPLALWCLHFIEANRMRSFVAASLLLMLCREEMPVITLLLSIYAFMSGRGGRAVWAVVAISIVYGVIVNFVVMADAFSYDYYFNGIRTSHESAASGIVQSLFTNPVYVLRYMLEEPKILYILKLTAPLLLLPLFAGRLRVLFLFGLCATLFGSRSGLFMTSLQYTAWWVPFLIASIPMAIENLSQGKLAGHFGWTTGRLHAALVVGVLLSSLSMSSLYGAYLPNTSFRAGYSKLNRTSTEETLRRYGTLRKIDDMIPKDAPVSATMRIAPHFAARNLAWCFGRNELESQPADYIVLWDGDFEYKNAPLGQDKQLAALRKSKAYKKIFRENGLTLYAKEAREAQPLSR